MLGDKIGVGAFRGFERGLLKFNLIFEPGCLARGSPTRTEARQMDCCVDLDDITLKASVVEYVARAKKEWFLTRTF